MTWFCSAESSPFQFSILRPSHWQWNVMLLVSAYQLCCYYCWDQDSLTQWDYFLTNDVCLWFFSTLPFPWAGSPVALTLASVFHVLDLGLAAHSNSYSDYCCLHLQSLSLLTFSLLSPLFRCSVTSHFVSLGPQPPCHHLSLCHSSYQDLPKKWKAEADLKLPSEMLVQELGAHSATESEKESSSHFH